MRDLKSMGNTKHRDEEAAPAPQEVREAAARMDGRDMAAIEKAVEQYGGKSEEELMGELMDFRKRGQIDDASLSAVAARLAPMLNEQQRQRLESVMANLKGS